MRTNKFVYISAFLMASAAFFGAWQIRIAARTDAKALSLDLTTENASYAAGEVIELKFAITNNSDKADAITAPDVGTGSLKVFLSGDGKDYREYVGPNWGALDAGQHQLKLAAGARFETNATMLYNQRLATGHLTPMYAERIDKARIPTEFAITEPGRYWIKASYTNGKDVIRSAPVEIEITTPVGQEAIVWDQIRSDGAFAYMLQTGDVRYLPGSAESEDFDERLRQVTSDYPETGLTRRLGQKIDQYKRNVEYVERLKADHQ